jgi:uncharacterized membrane protein
VATDSAAKPITHPAWLSHDERRRSSLQNRAADGITMFAGSMWFVYIHVVWFASWIVFRVEDYPFGLLTMIVSLEAIFLSTFVMISQNRSASRDQALAEHHYQESQRAETILENQRRLLLENTDLTRKVHELTVEIRRLVEGTKTAR